MTFDVERGGSISNVLIIFRNYYFELLYEHFWLFNSNNIFELNSNKFLFSFKWFLIKAISIFLVLLIFALFIYSAPGLIMQRLLGG